MPKFANPLKTAEVMLGKPVPEELKVRLERVQELYIKDGGEAYLSRQFVAAIIEQFERERESMFPSEAEDIGRL